MLQGEHSAILSTFIKLLFVIKIFVLSIFEWPLKTGFTSILLYCLVTHLFQLYTVKYHYRMVPNTEHGTAPRLAVDSIRAFYNAVIKVNKKFYHILRKICFIIGRTK